METNVAEQLCPQFVRTVGLEAEGWSYDESSRGISTKADGFWTDDAGLNQCEAVTNPQPSIGEALSVLQKMVAKNSVRFEPFRPLDLMYNAGCWQSDLKYKERVASLGNESPGNLDWVEYKMPNYASLQVSAGGDFDPFGNEGAFLINMFNDVAPWHAAVIHDEIGYGHGHLGLWQYFGYAERFPQFGRWFSSGCAMIEYIESVPRLVRSAGEDFVRNPPGETQDAQNPLDLQNMWWYARPKIGEIFGPYLEIRHLPSMPLDTAERYVRQPVEMIELLLSWFFGENAGQPVCTREDALPAFQLLHDRFGRYVPAVPLDEATWMRLMQEG